MLVYEDNSATLLLHAGPEELLAVQYAAVSQAAELLQAIVWPHTIECKILAVQCTSVAVRQASHCVQDMVSTLAMYMHTCVLCLKLEVVRFIIILVCSAHTLQETCSALDCDD
jgi:hypothetical protein